LIEAKAVTLNFQNAPLTEVLAAVFKNQALEYNIENKTILVSKKKISNQVTLPSLRACRPDGSIRKVLQRGNI
jgi:type II secretory pathway component GspD/PulD (secretin)